MKTSKKMQEVVTQLAAKHGLDLGQPGTRLRLDMPGFDRLVIEPLGLDEHPGLCDAYFGNYTRLVYLSQSLDATLVDAARAAAERLELAFEHVHCGLDELESAMAERVLWWGDDQDDFRLLE